mgnify:CR=1 FL=1
MTIVYLDKNQRVRGLFLNDILKEKNHDKNYVKARR